MKQKTWTLLIFAVAAGLGLLVYGSTVALPLFLDDASNFRWLTPTGGLDVWITAGGFPFYRPLPFTLFKLLWHLQGGYDAPTLHALVVALHILNAALVGLLARRLTGRPAVGPVAAGLMLAFPFSYQAVALVGSIFHLTLVAGTVSAALLALRYLERGERWALAGAWLAAFVGVFSHENGVLLPLLVGLVLIAGSGRVVALRSRWRHAALLPGPMAGMAALYFAAWLLVPKANDAGGILWAALDAKIAYFAQGAVYPLSALLRPLFTDEPAVVPVTLLLAVVGIGGALGVLWWTQRRAALRIALLALLWIGIAAGPSVLLLPAPYLLGGPRLLYLSSVGVALFWAAWLAALVDSRIGRIAGGAIIAAFLLVGLWFGIRRVTDYGRLGTFYGGFIQAVRTQPETPTLLVNAPAFIAPRRGMFLLGAEGATYLLDFITLQDLVWVNTGRDYPVETVAFANTLVETGEVFSVRGPWVDWDGLDAALAESESVFNVTFSGDGFHLSRVGDRLHEGITAPAATYDGDGLRLAAEYAADDTPPVLTLNWWAAAPPPATVFVHVLCGGELVAQFDGAPLGGLHPFDRWEPGEAWADHRPLFGLSCPPESILFGLYDPASGERYPAALPDGATADAITIIPGMPDQSLRGR